jgi:hypothetical protein
MPLLLLHVNTHVFSYNTFYSSDPLELILCTYISSYYLMGESWSSFSTETSEGDGHSICSCSCTTHLYNPTLGIYLL